MSYIAPIKDMRFVLNELAGLDQIQQLPGFEDASTETVDAVLEENARLVQDVIAPLNRIGDQQPSSWKDGEVITTPGFKQAFTEYASGGWQGLQHPQEFGGQGLPKLVASACVENLHAANLSFALCPLLTDGAIEALLTAGSEEQKNLYVPHLIDGSWTGTMNLTEPQAGSDLSQGRPRAVPQDAGSFRLFGTKSFIPSGEPDMAENIVHLVLGRTPDAPEGVKGISLFVVPKFLVDADGKLGKRNDVWCPSIEHKLGIKASPTTVLLFGDDKGDVGAGAVGYAIGELNRGLQYMFVMMNAARFAVGVEGVAVSERAYQQAVHFARDRKQSRAVEGSAAAVAIIEHPDVRRMLMTMRALTEGARAVAFVAAGAHDLSTHHPDADVRAQNQAFYEYLVPIIKGFSTEMSLEVTSLGVQVHGGMGFIEETGAAQHYRDSRILTIYEGTTAIQANDLIGRKTVRDGGATAYRIVEEIRKTVDELERSKHASLVTIGARLEMAVEAYAQTIQFVLEEVKDDVRGVYAGSVAYLMLAGYVHGGWQMARAAQAAVKKIEAGDLDPFYETKLVTARFYAEHLLPRALSLHAGIVDGAESVLALGADQF